jgi:beta-1,4-N-acetylglucosaminyltransferase
MWPSSQQVAGLLFALIVLAVLAVRLSRCPRPSELMLILGSGGHTT